MSCFDEERVLEILRKGELSSPAVQAHLDVCPACRKWIAVAIRSMQSDRPSISSPPPPGGTLPLAEVDAAHEAEGDPLYPGRVIEHRYILEGRLGTGGMGVVWAARRTDTGTRVALKVIRLFDAETLLRVEREARIAQDLAHPNLVRIHEVLAATHLRGPILVMDLLEGETFRKVLVDHGRFGQRDAARFLLPVVSTLEAAHERKVVHRDLKPENIFRTNEGRIFVLDFGVARLLPSSVDSTRLTRSGTILGTPKYMAPEQIFGERTVDHRADIWALGVILYEVLSGRLPVGGDNLGDVMRSMQVLRIDPITRLAPTITPDIATLIMRSLSRDPAQRPGSVSEFLAPLSMAAR